MLDLMVPSTAVVFVKTREIKLIQQKPLNAETYGQKNRIAQ